MYSCGKYMREMTLAKGKAYLNMPLFSYSGLWAQDSDI